MPLDPSVIRGHVVRNEIEQQPQATRAETLAQSCQRGVPAQLRMHGVAGDGEPGPSDVFFAHPKATVAWRTSSRCDFSNTAAQGQPNVEGQSRLCYERAPREGSDPQASERVGAMRKFIVSSCVVVSVLLTTGWAQADENLVEGLKKACNRELTTFCKGVQPGEGRILACLYAFQDRVSGKCDYAIYDAATELEHAATALKFAAAECKDDLLKYCGNVQVGQGRVKACLDKNEQSLSEKCKEALKQTGIKK